MPSVVTIVIALIAALIGTGTGGFLVAWRRDRRQAPIDAAVARRTRIEVTDLIDQMATRAVEKAKKQLEEQERDAKRQLLEQKKAHDKDLRRVNHRVELLEEILRDNGIPVPPWREEEE